MIICQFLLSNRLFCRTKTHFSPLFVTSQSLRCLLFTATQTPVSTRPPKFPGFASPRSCSLPPHLPGVLSTPYLTLVHSPHCRCLPACRPSLIPPSRHPDRFAAGPGQDPPKPPVPPGHAPAPIGRKLHPAIPALIPFKCRTLPVSDDDT
jgi:hypothetical protein